MTILDILTLSNISMLLFTSAPLGGVGLTGVITCRPGTRAHSILFSTGCGWVTFLLFYCTPLTYFLTTPLDHTPIMDTIMVKANLCNILVELVNSLNKTHYPTALLCPK